MACTTHRPCFPQLSTLAETSSCKRALVETYRDSPKQMSHALIRCKKWRRESNLGDPPTTFPRDAGRVKPNADAFWTACGYAYGLVPINKGTPTYDPGPPPKKVILILENPSPQNPSFHFLLHCLFHLILHFWRQ